jgi:hypothetical protein
MRPRLAIGLLAALLPLPALAQTSTEDGVRAFVRGDYATAARILSPLAESSADADPTAQFFMGLLYAAGKGVPMDPMRACTLFSAAAAPSNPFMEQASAVAGMMQQNGSGGMLCGRPPAIGPKPTSFTLAPDYTLDVRPYELVVHYHGIQKTEPLMPIPGAVNLPVRYTPLDVKRPAAARRHFVEQAMWWQEPRGGSTWRLGWLLGEIVDGAYVPVASEREVASTADARPPAPFNLAGVVRVHVNAQGEAEWQILGGPRPRTEVIPVKAPK